MKPLAEAAHTASSVVCLKIQISTNSTTNQFTKGGHISYSNVRRNWSILNGSNGSIKKSRLHVDVTLKLFGVICTTLTSSSARSPSLIWPSLELTTLIRVKDRLPFRGSVAGTSSASLVLKLRRPNAAEKDLRPFTDATKDKPAADAASEATSASETFDSESRRFPTTATPASRHRAPGDAASVDILSSTTRTTRTACVAKPAQDDTRWCLRV